MDARVQAQQLQLLVLRPTEIGAHLIVGAAAIGGFHQLFPIGACAAWLLALGAVLFVRNRLQVLYRRQGAEGASSRVWGRRYTWAAFANGVVWGLLSLVFVVTPDLRWQMLALALIGGMTIAGIARNAAYTAMMVAFVAPIIGLSAIALLIHPSAVHLAIVAMLAAFGAVLATNGRSLHQAVNSDLRLTLELVKTGASLGAVQGAVRSGSWEIDTAQRSLLWSAEMYSLLNLPQEVTPSIAELVARTHPEDRERLEAGLEAWLSGQSDLAVDHRIVFEGSESRWLHQFGLAQSGAGASRRTVIVQDITERKAAEERLLFANVVLKTQLEASEDGVLVVSRQGRIITQNDTFLKLFEFSPETLGQIDHPTLKAHMLAVIAEPSDPERLDRLFTIEPEDEGHIELKTRHGRLIQTYTAPLAAPDGEALGHAWYFRDVTEERQALARAIREATLDPLTGLLNRGAFVERLTQAIAAAAAGGPTFAILYLDLDHFKDINDALGHPAGDELLRLVAERLTSLGRRHDTIARFGGDEFAIIASGVAEPDDAAQLAQRLVATLGRPCEIRGVPVRTSASVGITCFDGSSLDADTLLARADLALYGAKADGRATARAFTEAMDVQVRTRLALGAELHDAIDDGQLFLLYQPQVDVASGRVVGVEALVRWRHPSRGILGPGMFIPVAEQTGVIGKLGDWVIEAACRQTRLWLDAGALAPRTAVNVSSLQFKSPLALEQTIDAALERHGVRPDQLEIELTETVLMHAYKDQADLLIRLRRKGVSIAIDDFGTGYSSLDYLRRFPVDRIKIAQDFVRDLAPATGDAAIVKATIGLARELGADIIAEGVERQRQFELLQAWGCTEVQGYYFAQPLEAEQISDLLKSDAPLLAGARLAPRRGGRWVPKVA